MTSAAAVNRDDLIRVAAFGEETRLDLARVVGSSIARIAGAEVAAFS